MLPASDNLSATKNPGASSYNTQAYTVRFALREYHCATLLDLRFGGHWRRSWALAGFAPGVDAEPANISALFGGGIGIF